MENQKWEDIMNMNIIIAVALTIPILSVGCMQSTPSIKNTTDKPNILWIIAEDMSCDFGYQGNSLVTTLNVDKLVREGVAFTNAYTTAPVCSASRSALITGMYQTTIGAHNHCSSRGDYKISLPVGMNTIPEYFRKAGYYVCNTGYYEYCNDQSFGRNGKTDYNFVFNSDSLYNAPQWTKRKRGQPFFAQVQLRGGKLRDIDSWYKGVEKGLSTLVSADNVIIPPYYPHDSVIRTDWAHYLNTVQYTDKEVGKIPEKLKADGDLDKTIIFFITDHGISHARGKQFLYDEGTKIPFIVWAPERLKHEVRTDLIAHIDIAATSLYFSGIPIPSYLEAKPLFGPDYIPRMYIVSARDRCDETVDRIRSIRIGNFKYIHNYYPGRPYLQPNAYKDHKPTIKDIRKLEAEGKLNNIQLLVTAKTRPVDELYDLISDTYEIHNLANNPEYSKKLSDMRTALDNWIKATDDNGQYGEPEESYNTSMEVYLKGQIMDKKIMI